MLLHNLVDQAAERYPDAPAVTREEHTLTHAALRDAGLRLTGWLAARGLTRGDRIVIGVPGHPLVPALIYAASRLGVIFSVVHEQVRGRPLAHLLGDCTPRLLITGDEAAGRHGVPICTLAEVAAALRHPPGAPHEPPGASHEPLSVDPVCLIYTSGSTALPKAVVSTHAQVMFAVRAIHHRLGYRPEDLVYCPLPLSFDYGLYQLFLGALSGAHVRLGTAADAGQGLLTGLSRSAATVLPAVPSIATTLAALLRRRPEVPLALRLLTSTGAAMPRPVLDELRHLLPGLRVQLMFGLTECKRVSIMEPDEDLRRPAALGRPLPDTEVFAVAEDGTRLGPGEAGELVVRGGHVMSGYWRRPDLTARVFRRVDGLAPELHTGDHGWLDEDGYLYFAGRRDDIYKQGGFRVSALEVEAAAHRVPGVKNAAVLPPGGDRATAVLFVTGQVAPGEVVRLLREELEDFKIPGTCLVRDRLPLTSNGKTCKQTLAASLMEDSHA